MNWRARSNKPDFLARLVDGDDPTVDSLIVVTLAAIAGFISIGAWDVIKLHHEFSPSGYGTGSGAIIASLGGGKLLRGKGAKPDQPSASPNA